MLVDPRDVSGRTIYRVESSPSALVSFAYNGRPRAEDGDDPGSDNVPGHKVRAQTRDVADLLFLAHALYGVGGDEWVEVGSSSSSSSPSTNGGGGILSSDMAAYMFLEDDFRVCPHGLSSLAYAILRAESESMGGGLQGVFTPSSSPTPWNAIRVSYGLNGGVLRGSDVTVFAGYLTTHLFRRPPDHLWVEWFAGETPESAGHKGGRPHFAFRYNILEHFGYASSLREKVSPLYARCYQVLDSAVVFEVEAFKLSQCAHDHVWPCWDPTDARYASLTKTEIDFELLFAQGDTVQTWQA